MQLHWVPFTTSTLMHEKVLIVTRCSLYPNFLTLRSMRWCWLDTNLLALCIRVLVITELAVSGTQCTIKMVNRDIKISYKNSC